MMTVAFLSFYTINAALPFGLSHLLTSYYHPTTQQYHLVKSFSLLLLGMFLSSLATLNFSLALLVGLLASPLSFVCPWPNAPAARWASASLLIVVSPATVLALSQATLPSGLGVSGLLRWAAFGWDVWGVYTPVVVWCVWWPAWLCGSLIVLGRPDDRSGKTKTA